MGTGCVKIVVGLRVVIDGARINTKIHKKSGPIELTGTEAKLT